MNDNPTHELNAAATPAAVGNAHASASKPARRRRPRQKPQGEKANQDQLRDVKPDQPTASVDVQASTNTPAKKPNSRRKKGGNNKKKVEGGKEGTAETGESAAAVAEPQNHPPRSKGKSRFNKNRPQGQLTDTTADVPVVAATPIASSATTAPKRRNNNRRSRNQNSRISQLKEDEIKDLLTSLTHGLTTSTYECMICWDVVRPGQQTWSCDCCWAVFHLGCVQTWANKSLNGKHMQIRVTKILMINFDFIPADATSNLPVKNWRCPGCQYTRTVIPKEYVCFCGKQLNPDYNKYITPHSCGQLCGSKRDCPHECVLPCHPGPCPPCSAMSPVTSCFCGSETYQTRCVDTDYSSLGRSCGKVCGELLGCGKHSCKSECHAGLCPPCDVEEVQSCYCGKHERTAKCGSGSPVQSGNITGYYSCKATCNHPFACGKHFCTQLCHPLESNPPICPFDPSIVNSCPCGSSTVEPDSRKSCQDPVPTCSRVCYKPLPCGHNCLNQCHTGNCRPCTQKVKVACRCGSSTFERTCHTVVEAAGGEAPQCDRVCGSLKNCGRHQCSTKCCPAASAGKSAGKKKATTSKGESSGSVLHECDMVCDRKLKCGRHSCKLPCHKGRCPPCMEAEWNEVSCHCGRTRLEPPIRCGTTLPPCTGTCVRPSSCGHVRLLNHNCHPDEEPCPPCSVLVERRCMCGKSLLKNIPCFRGAPSCGTVCASPLPCGHLCRRVCHKAPCLSEGEHCKQLCGKIKKCGHACEEKCHAPDPCSAEKKCTAKVMATCECGLQKLEVACNATATSSGSKRVLACNDYCAKADRNRRLAAALEINRPTDPAEAENVEYPEETRAYYVSNPTWCRNIVSKLDEFVKDEAKRNLNFKPMKPLQRKFIHEMCEVYQLKSEGVDPEPYRSVIVSKSQGEGKVPKNPIAIAAYQKRKPGSLTAINSVIPPIAVEQLRKSFKPAINAMYLADLSFGLIKEDLDKHLEHAFGAIKFVSKWLDTDAVVMPYTGSMSLEEIEVWLLQTRKELRSTLIPKGIVAHVDCCWVNKDGEIVWPGGKSPYEKAKEAIAAKEGDQKLAPVRVDNTFGALQDEPELVTEAEDEDGWTTIKRNTKPASIWNDVSDLASLYVSPSVLQSGSSSQGTEPTSNEDPSNADTVENWEALEE
ncbi:hypothetical protein NQZ79_g3835 [Umbelopsis isabellina]|nr:hypothetical protein NQZ79_g3835 [Umbelopsis isabellina]